MTTPLFTKLNLKDQSDLLVLNAPDSFASELAKLPGLSVKTSLTGKAKTEFFLAFVTKQAEVDRLAAALGTRTEGDTVVWFAYPKGSSKRYTCEFNRDTGWAAVGAAGFEPVRMVAIDEDWSALRFRRAEFIKALTRAPKHAISAAGRKRAGAKRR
jgi:hypothetical protein